MLQLHLYKWHACTVGHIIHHRCAVLAGMYSQSAEEVQLAWRAGLDALPNWCGPSATQPAWSVTRLEQGNEMRSFADLGNFSYSRATLDFTRDPNRFMLNYFATALITVSFSECMALARCASPSRPLAPQPSPSLDELPYSPLMPAIPWLPPRSLGLICLPRSVRRPPLDLRRCSSRGSAS